MIGQWLFLLLLVNVSISSVFSRHNFYEHFYSKYHKVSSTTASSTTSDDSSSGEVHVSEGNNFHSTSNTGNQTPNPDGNETVLQQGNSYSNDNDDVKYVFIARIGIIVGSVIGFVCIFGCIVCCCPGCCRGRERRGFILESRDDRAAEVQPQLPVVIQYPQQSVAAQHFPPLNQQPQQLPPQYTQEVQQFPPQYTQQPLQQYPPQQIHHPSQLSPGHLQGQYSPTALQFYNPPEAPPPYDTPTKVE